MSDDEHDVMAGMVINKDMIKLICYLSHYVSYDLSMMRREGKDTSPEFTQDMEALKAHTKRWLEHNNESSLFPDYVARGTQ